MNKLILVFTIIFSLITSKDCFSACNWKGKNPQFTAWDTCNVKLPRKSVNAYISFQNAGCYKYKWTVNNTVLNTTSNIMTYAVTQNGTYNICVKVTDTCNKCDTTYCTTKTISCFSSCNWKSKNPIFVARDSCKIKSVYAYLFFQNSSCLKYQWTVNNTILNSTGYRMTNAISQNGSYNICVKVTDTCNKCDTTYCATIKSNCFPNCNWKGRNGSLFAYDSCKGNVNKIMTGISFNGSFSGIYKCYWTLNNVNVGNTSSVQQLIVTQNGTYTVCVKAIDTINNCDTTYCKTITVSCIKNCNWSVKKGYFFAKDSCSYNVKRITGAISFSLYDSGQYNYVWSINNNVVGRSAGLQHFIVPQNGNYTICVKVMDTINKCDTIFCKNVYVNCPSNCNWKARNPQFTTWDSCNGRFGRKSVNAYISFQNSGCYKYQWTVNNSIINTKSNIMSYAITQNGTYTICVKVTDTCNKCDTTYCATKTISCFSNCNWKARNPQFTTWDSCNGRFGRKSVNAYISFQNSGCYKYQWTVNNSIVITKSNIMSYAITQNGTYTICVKVTDTCNKCDTTYCTTKTINCFSNCNWKARNPQFTTWDSCNSSRKSVNAYISFQNAGCLKYQWIINNTLLNTTSNIMSYTITQNGTYNICVKVTDTCKKCDTTYCVTKKVSCFSSKVITNKYDEIKIYPNPANKYITIENKPNSVIVIYNILGEKVYSSTLLNATNSILVENWTKGIYIIQIEHSGVKKTQKIIIN